MTKAFEKIAEGLTEALAIARGEKKPARLYVPPEIDAIRRAMQPAEQAAAKERQGERTDRKGTSGQLSQKSADRTRDRPGLFAGVSAPAVERSKMHRYTNCGLDYVWLVNGFEHVETPQGRGVRIHDLGCRRRSGTA